MLIDDGDDDDDDATQQEHKSYAFELKEKESYILCGDARNKCVHGVLCSIGNDDESLCQRETLNLRYGLHSVEFAQTEIDQHWLE